LDKQIFVTFPVTNELIEGGTLSPLLLSCVFKDGWPTSSQLFTHI